MIKEKRQTREAVPAHVIQQIDNVFELLLNSKTHVSSDDIWKLSLSLGIKQEFVGQSMARLFRRKLHAKQMQSTGRFIISERNSKPICLYSRI